MIEKFSKTEFEDALFTVYPLCQSIGLIDGEECYSLAVNDTARLMIRSSIDSSGFAASSGEDSIRLWLQVRLSNGKWQAVGKKADAYTTRVSGWQERLETKIRFLWPTLVKFQKPVTDCPSCGASRWPNLVKKEGKNQGRPFVSCQCGKGFEWLDEAIQNGSKVSFEVPLEVPAPVLEFEPEPLPEPKPSFVPSVYQQAIFDFVESGTGHGLVYGVAGCGKTTTNIQALSYVDPFAETVFLAFNRHIADELKHRGVGCASTFHSLGRTNIQAAKPSAKFNQYKIYDILDKVEIGLSYDEKSQIAKIIGLLKGNLLEPDNDTIEYIIDEFPSIGIIDDRDKPSVIRITKEAFKKSINNVSEYDFDDMIHWPAIGLVPCRQFDFIFVDECQDLNKAQITFAENSMREGGRMLLIGDPMQSIYAFRGAYVGIMDYMREKLQAAGLPLTISYRAPLAIVDYVNEYFPQIVFEAAPGAIQGSIENIGYQGFLSQVQIGDGILCRTNAPLVEPCFDLIRQGIKATILGRDIGQGLISLINKRAKLVRVQNQLPNLIEELYVYLGNEKLKLEAAKKFGRLAALQDQIETIVAIADGCQTIDELISKVKSVFADDQKGIVFSSIHKAKGLEWDRVFILRPDLLPHPMAQSDRDRQQENNIKYVAVTRAKQNLYFVNGK